MTLHTVTEINTIEEGRRRIIFLVINNDPGLRYRELLRLTGFSNGSLEHHLSILEKTKTIQVHRQKKCKITRYYSKHVSTEESKIISWIKQETAYKIIAFILKKNLCTFAEILKHIRKARSTLSWHLKRLIGVGIIQLVRTGRYNSYRIINVDMVSMIINKMIRV